MTTTTNQKASIQKSIEDTMISEVKELGFSEIRIDEFNKDGKLVSSKSYKTLRPAVKKMINHAQGYFPIYQGSSVMQMGYKMKIALN